MTDEEAYQNSLKKSEELNAHGFGTHFVCCALTFDTKQAIAEHLRAVHGIDTKTQKFTTALTMHMDGRDWYASSYSWSCDAVTFMQYHKGKRDKNDMMRFA